MASCANPRPALSRLSSQLTSSPLSSAPSYDAQVDAVISQTSIWSAFCKVRELPYELQKQVEIYFEESLFSQSFDFLNGSLSAYTASTVRFTNLGVPSPECLRLIVTLSIHPTFTSRATQQDRLQSATSAIEYLWNLVKTAGPINLNLAQVFLYHNHEALTNATRQQSQDDESDTQTKLTIRYARGDGLFNLSADFWNVVGWIMNCACSGGIQEVRWQYWSQWLELMLYILEIDWEMREEQDTCHESLLWHYIEEADGGHGKARRMLRAIFADGTGSAVSEFREIFRSELKPPKAAEDKDMQNIAVKVDQDIYGDWLDATDSESDKDTSAFAADHDPRPSKRARYRAPRRKNPSKLGRVIKEEEGDSDSSAQSASAPEKGLGSLKAIGHRLRLLQLLSRASAHAEIRGGQLDSEFPDPHELFTLFVEFIQPLPINVFSQIVLPSRNAPLHEEMRIALCEFILQRMVGNNQQTRRSTFAAMTKERFVSDYLTFDGARNKIDVQAKVSILLESIMRQVAETSPGAWVQDDDVIAALHEGIRKRSKKAQDIWSTKSRKSQDRQGQLAMDMLRESEQRMLAIVQLRTA